MNVPITKLATALAVATLISACGGGGDPGPRIELSGTAATGKALAGNAVQVKCAVGSGSATTEDTGRYSLTISDGRLPCMIRVVGDAEGTSVSLHSLVEAGTTVDGKTTALANVTPLTEMIVAHLAAALPASLFEGFGSGNAISAEQLAAAASTVLGVIREVTGIDGSALDPFKASLVAASAENPTGGNAHDKLLDTLGATVPAGSLAVIASEIAKAAGAGDSARQALTGVFSAAHSGDMPGCPVARSGPYRAVDYSGRTLVNRIDFKALKYNRADGQPMLDIRPLDPARPCEFTAAGVFDGSQVEHRVVMGPSGAGAFRAADLSAGSSTVGHIFPEQAIGVADGQGAWTLVQSGEAGADNRPFSKLSMAQVNGSALQTCDFRSGQNFACGNPASMTVSARDGYLELIEGSGALASVVARVYGFRAPDQTLTLYGTVDTRTTPSAAGPTRAHFVATRPRTLKLPAVNDVSRYWDANLTIAQGVAQTTLAPDAITITEADPSISVVRRSRSSDGRRDRMHYNLPIAGVRLREAGVHEGEAFAAALQMPLPIGVTVTTNLDPTGTHFHVISVARP